MHKIGGKSRAHIGMDLFGPAPDFAGLARSRRTSVKPAEKVDPVRVWLLVESSNQYFRESAVVPQGRWCLRRRTEIA